MVRLGNNTDAYFSGHFQAYPVNVLLYAVSVASSNTSTRCGICSSHKNHSTYIHLYHQSGNDQTNLVKESIIDQSFCS
jgi:hypothetical protein